MRYGSVCSGIEAATVAWHPLGWEAAWFSEIEKFPSEVLKHHYPEVENLGDMTRIATRVLSGEVHAPDVLVGGTPCQAFSVAGLRNSLNDDRGQLSISFIHLADAIDAVRSLSDQPPAVIVWENVPGVLSTSDNAFGCFLAGLAGEDSELLPSGKKWTNAGCVYGPKRTVAWRILDAQYFGVAQRRRRVFVVASARDGFDPAAVLFEREGVRRDTAPSRQAGEGATHATAPCLTSSGRGVERTGDTRGQDPVVAVFGGNNCSGPIEVATARNACSSASGRMDFESETFVTHTLRGEGFDASEDGTGRGTPLVPVPINFGAQMSAPSRQTGEDVTSTALCSLDVSCAGTLTAGFGKIGAPEIDAYTATPWPANVAATLNAAFGEKQGLEDQHINQGAPWFVPGSTPMQVRRLTPVECERLQGFPDSYTDIKPNGKPTPDGPRYKALGNSMAVPVMAWIGRRIAKALA